MKRLIIVPFILLSFHCFSQGSLTGVVMFKSEDRTFKADIGAEVFVIDSNKYSFEDDIIIDSLNHLSCLYELQQHKQDRAMINGSYNLSKKQKNRMLSSTVDSASELKKRGIHDVDSYYKGVSDLSPVYKKIIQSRKYHSVVDGTGNFIVRGLPDGTYYVYISSKNDQSRGLQLWSQRITISNGDDVTISATFY